MTMLNMLDILYRDHAVWKVYSNIVHVYSVGNYLRGSLIISSHMLAKAAISF